MNHSTVSVQAAISASPTVTAIGISVIILTHDEESNIRGCLESVAWSDDVIVVDSFSNDGTIAAARSCRPTVRVFENAFKDFGQQRNWALDHTSPRHAWILFLDADERITATCSAEMARAVDQPGGHVGYFLCGRNFFLGRWVRHCQLFPSWQLRLLKRGEVRYRKEGHGQREVTEGPLGYIREPYDHLTFSKGVAEWLGRHNRYSTHEIELIQRLRTEPMNPKSLFHRDPVERRRCLKTLAARLPCRPLFRFLYGYVIRCGFLDGRAGLVLCLLRFAQDIDTMAKLAEMKAIEQGMPPDHGPTKRQAHS